MRNAVDLGVGHAFRGLQTANTLGWLPSRTCIWLRGPADYRDCSLETEPSYNPTHSPSGSPILDELYRQLSPNIKLDYVCLSHIKKSFS